MFWIFKKKSLRLFLDENIKVTVHEKEKYDIILSPTLYWVKKLSLPIKYIYEAKKIAPAIFEDNLTEGSYNYFVCKEADDFLLFAYNDKQILELLQKKGIPLTAINTISFAQLWMSDTKDTYDIGNNVVITVKNHIVVLLPKNWFDDVKNFDLTALSHPKKSISLQQFGHIVTRPTLYKIGGLLLFFIALLIVQYIILLQEKTNITVKKEKIFKNYELKPTLMQNKAILSKYEKIDKEQRTLRKYINDILQLHLIKKVQIKSIVYANGVLHIVFINVSPSDEKQLLALLYKKKIQFTKAYKNNKLQMDIKI